MGESNLSKALRLMGESESARDSRVASDLRAQAQFWLTLALFEEMQNLQYALGVNAAAQR